MSFKCLECNEEFGSRKSLHAHIKKHDMLLGDYYVKHFKRRNKLTGELLPFKNYDDYFNRDFSQPHQLLEWCDKAPYTEVKTYITKLLQDRIDRLNLDYGPSNLELVTAGLPPIDVYKRFYSSYTDACKACGVLPWLDKPLLKEFWEKDFKHVSIFVDTRERKPLWFPKTKPLKLDVGDYAPEHAYFNYTFVDRKTLQDLCSTVTASYNRFCNELDRCREIGCFVFVVIEVPFEEMGYRNRRNYKKWNLPYVYHKMREIQMMYKDCCQFVFGGTRKDCADLIPRLLVLGQKLWKTDIDYFWNKHLNKHGMATR